MSSLVDLVSKNQPKFQTHQALLVIGLQNDFLLPDGRLPVSTEAGFLERIQALIPRFRELSGNVVWVQTLYEADRIATGADTGEGDAMVVGGLLDGEESSTEAGDEELVKEPVALPPQSRSSKHKQRALDLLKRVSARRKTMPKEVARAAVEGDEELFLLKSEKRTPACVPDTYGAEFADVIARQFELPADVVIRTTNYSAFQGTNLLATLRARLVTELFICGCITNVSVLATVIDAARHGIRIYVIEDCLGFRKQTRHDTALKRMEELFSAYIVNSVDILAQEPLAAAEKTSGVLSGKQRTLSLVSAAEARKAAQNPPEAVEEPTALHGGESSDKEFTEMLTKGATVPGAEENAEKPKLVKTKIRMRRGKNKKKKKDKDAEVSGETVDSAIRPHIPSDFQRSSLIAKAGSVADLRGNESKQHQLKNAASVPVLSSKTNGEEKEKNRLSDFSDRVRLSLSRAPKPEPAAESKRASISSTKASSITPKHEEKQLSRKVSQSVTAQPDTPPASISQQTPAKSSTMGKTSKIQSLANLPVLGPGDHIGEGDSRIITDFFPSSLHHPTDPSVPLQDLVFTQLYNEVRWQKMLHQQGEVPRLVCCQGSFGEDGSMPIYRHPADQTLPLLHFSPKVQLIRKQAEKLCGHPLNHVLIQLYRSGNDFISEHSDKTLDIVKGSSIVNVSFGAQRTMRLRRKKAQAPLTEADDSTAQRETQRMALPHNSMFILGLQTNKKWLHGIMPDKRLPSERSAAETSHNGIRISLTFRHIGTFLDAKESVIWGQGATAKHQREAADIVNGDADEEEAKRIITAFSRENHDPDFDWEEWYANGFDVLHLHAPSPPDLPLLFLSNNEISNRQVIIALAESKIKYTTLPAPDLPEKAEEEGEKHNDEEASETETHHHHISFRDTDTHHTEITTPTSILLYLDRYHHPLTPSSHPITAATYPILALASRISHHRPAQLPRLLAALEEQLSLHDGPFIAGPRFSIADAFVWPLVDGLVREWSGWDEGVYVGLGMWYRACFRMKAAVRRVVVGGGGE
ncbi:hypothetical protein BDW02DRAFT_531736, partial [Decorospora gaudefroyi]